MKKKILIISHDFVKKVNIRIYEELNKNKGLKILCVRPKKLYLNKKLILKDFEKKNCKVDIVETKTTFKNLRFLYFKNIFNIIIKFKPSDIILHSDPVSLQTIILILVSYFRNFSLSCISNENKVLKFKNKFEISILIRSLILLFMNLVIRNKIKHIFCITKQIKKNYNFLGYKKKTVLMPLGFDQNLFKKKKYKEKQGIYNFILWENIT